MTKPFLASVEVNPEAPPVASVIWMHGLGANGYDFASVPPQLGLPSELAVRYVFPHAPSIPVTINQGCIMPAWYDIKSFDARGQDEPGIRRNAGGIRQLIAREVEGGVAPGKIVVAGFSQGGHCQVDEKLVRLTPKILGSSPSRTRHAGHQKRPLAST